ncbi:hypothetical protein Scep_019577 [Stephania cephalantha]|uniref:EGF-like calcium-binding domain-containing protein n=1 Tax=Stephania cephalantha TaxID=152367 RepID=A0AAP0NMA0_9MAGN
MVKFVVEKNSLTVKSPESMRGTHDSAIANFGIPKYGGSMAGTVVYPKENQKAYCFFALKVWNAQKAGASAVLVADNIAEPLITMDPPQEDGASAAYIENITIPSALIDKDFDEKLKKAIIGGEMVYLNLDCREAVPHPDVPVEYELWSNSNDECGTKCDTLLEFAKDFKGVAQILERGGYTLFTPHYITWYCPEAFTVSRQYQSQCINHGRYCAPDPEEDFSIGYEGRDVVLENSRQLCVFRVARDDKRPWIWWNYVTDFQGLNSTKLRNVWEILMLTLIILFSKKSKMHRNVNERSCFEGHLFWFEEITEPSVCRTDDIQTNECMENNGGCWQDKAANITACKDTFRGGACECPMVDGLQFKGDGYDNCEASGDLAGARILLAATVRVLQGLEVMVSKAVKAKIHITLVYYILIKSDGKENRKNLLDIDECKEKKVCQCSECSCEDLWGDYECTCSGNLLYMKDHETCISIAASSLVHQMWHGRLSGSF